MTEVIYSSNEDDIRKWTLYDDCLVLPTGEKVSLWDARADRDSIINQGEKIGFSLLIYKNCAGKTREELVKEGIFPAPTRISSHDKEKLLEVADYINSSLASPPDMQKKTVSDMQKEIKKGQAKQNVNLIVGIIPVVIVVIVLAFVLSMCSGNKSSSKSDWDNLTSHQQEVAREAHDYKEALDKMKDDK